VPIVAFYNFFRYVDHLLFVSSNYLHTTKNCRLGSKSESESMHVFWSYNCPVLSLLKLFEKEHSCYKQEKTVTKLCTIYIVVSRPVAKQWLDKEQLLLGNACNTHMTTEERCFLCGPAHDQWGRHTPTTTEGLYFLHGPYQAVILKTTGATVKLQDVCWTVMTWAREAKESPLLEAVTRKRLVETVIDWGH
jgi:hypothetical protein